MWLNTLAFREVNMSVTIQTRFKRAYQVLEDEFKVMDTQAESDKYRESGVNLTWLRNEAKLWEDYEEDLTMVLGCCNVDPNHPDNLSSLVWDAFKMNYLGWYDRK